MNRKNLLAGACTLVAGLATSAAFAASSPQNFIPNSARGFVAAGGDHIATGSGYGGGTVTGTYVGQCNCFWDNGGFNPALDDGIWSIKNGFVSNSQAADDFFLPDCEYYRLDKVAFIVMTNIDSFDVIINDYETTYLNDAFLELYADCNGKPGELITSWSAQGILFPEEGEPQVGDVTATSLNQQWLGFDLYEVVWDLEDFGCWLEGGRAYWFSSYVLGGDHTDIAYIATAGAGDATTPNQTKLNQAHFIFEDNGFSTWTPVDVTNNKKSDLAMAVCLTECDVICDNGKATDIGGLTPQTNQVFGTIAADNFVLPPCKSYEIDMVQACVWTNCGCGNFVLEIWENDPETMCPGNLIASFGDPKEIPLGMTAMTTDTPPLVVEAFGLQFSELNLVLEGGKSYWISARNTGVVNASDRSYMCYAFDCDEDCQIKWMPAKIRHNSAYPWIDLAEDAGLTNYPDGVELSFQICGEVVDDSPPAGVVEVEVIKTDINDDSVVDLSDLLEFVNIWNAAYLGG